MSIVLDGSSPQAIARAAELLCNGGLVAFPTETVYGLGADACNERAVRRVFAAKGRPADHPLIVHLGSEGDLDRWAQDIPAAAWHLVERFWPGPLTLILKRRADVADVVTGGQETIGLRMPGHPVALALLRATGRGIAAPSANRFGRISPTLAEHASAELGDAIDGIVDGGPCSVGLESTILNLSGKRPQILRPGAITPAALAERLGEMPATGGADGPRVPGQLPAHYAPSTPLHLLDAAEIESIVGTFCKLESAIAVLSIQPPTMEAHGCRWQRMPGDPEGYARLLYASLREADLAGCRCILVEQPPATSSWEAVRDRLARAAVGAGLEPRDTSLRAVESPAPP